MTADERLSAGIQAGMTVKAAVEVVEAYLEEAGEIPEGLIHQFCMVVEEQGSEHIDRVVMRARAAWFRRQGRRVPRMPKPKFEWE